MKKNVMLLLAVIVCSLLLQSCFCEHDFYGPGPYVYRRHVPPPPPPHRHVYVW